MRGVIVAAGEVLVEIMRGERDRPLDTPGTFRGPFASGAPLIFACAAARLGASVRFAGVVGADAFGQLCETHLQNCAVEAQLRRVDTHTTGMAFVAYKQDGSRDFLFHFAQAAAGLLEQRDLTASLTADISWLHITGSSLSASESMRQACLHLVQDAKAQGATISFDPNLRLELMSAAAIRDVCGAVLEAADVILPSGNEAALLLGLDNPLDACQQLAASGAIVLLKQGSQGSLLFCSGEAIHIPTLTVTEVDPTGAGDAFAAGLAVARGRGLDWQAAARFASVVGALATQTFGPAEGLPSTKDVEAHL